MTASSSFFRSLFQQLKQRHFYSPPSSLSLDKALAAATVAGCLGLLLDADRKGRAPLLGSVPATALSHDADVVQDGDTSTTTATITARNNRVVSPEQCRQLERDGYLVVDNFLTTQQVQSALRAIHMLDNHGKFRANPDDHDNNNSVHERTSDRALINRTGVLDSVVRKSIAEFATSLAHSDFRGFQIPTTKSNFNSNNTTTGNDAYMASILLMPAQMQVNICGGMSLSDIDANAGSTETAAPSNTTASTASTTKTATSTYNFYHKHLDSAGALHMGELGLLGWLRSQHLRQRYLTCIVYLNPDWKEGDGGCLRMFTGTPQNKEQENEDDDDDDDDDDDSQYFDIQPLAGRMVVFSSSAQVHAVLPTKVQRYACAVWLALKE